MNQPHHEYENMSRIDYPQVEEDSTVAGFITFTFDNATLPAGV